MGREGGEQEGPQGGGTHRKESESWISRTRSGTEAEGSVGGGGSKSGGRDPALSCSPPPGGGGRERGRAVPKCGPPDSRRSRSRCTPDRGTKRTGGERMGKKEKTK